MTISKQYWVDVLAGGERSYGLVKRNGNFHIRNYRREINGGMTRFLAVAECFNKNLSIAVKQLKFSAVNNAAKFWGNDFNNR